MSARDWVRDVRSMVAAVNRDPDHIGVLSMGERCAVCLVLELADRRPRGYTFLDCVNRIEPELLAACIAVQRELGLQPECLVSGAWVLR